MFEIRTTVGYRSSPKRAHREAWFAGNFVPRITLRAAVSVVLASAHGLCLAAPSTASCETCHARQSNELASSVHGALGCDACHDGASPYTLEASELQRFTSQPDGPRPPFDHGPTFAGKPERLAVPTLCGNCHADVERMNPYGLRTDQLARYWTSGHGQSLRDQKDDRVAVCIDCHGNHDILPTREPASKTHPFNVPDTCGRCHADRELMEEYDLPVEIVEEYRQSVHGELLLDRGDTGAPTCVTCHGNHSAMPPGFATVGAVCGQCHQAAARNFSKSTHASQPEHKGCVQCHGGGEDRHFHLIERITKPTGVMIERYNHLLMTEPLPTPTQITDAIHPDPKKIIEHALSTCLDCHEELEDDESLPKLFTLLDEIYEAEREYVRTGRRLNEIGRGVLPVDTQRFKFEDAKTHLIQLAPLQHTLDLGIVAEKVNDLNTVCAEVNADLDMLEQGLRWRYRALIPIWALALLFSAACYAKYKQLKAKYVTSPSQDKKDD